MLCDEQEIGARHSLARVLACTLCRSASLGVCMSLFLSPATKRVFQCSANTLLLPRVLARISSFLLPLSLSMSLSDVYLAPACACSLFSVSLLAFA